MSQTPTTIEPWLREILRCPQCKGELIDSAGAAPGASTSAVSGGIDPVTEPGIDPVTEPGIEPVTEPGIEPVTEQIAELQCPACGLGYPIESGVPVLLVDLARRLG